MVAKKAKTKTAAPNTEVRRVNMTLTVDEYEQLEAAATKYVGPVKVTPTEFAKHLVMSGLEPKAAVR